MCFFFKVEDGIRDLVRSRGLGDVYKIQQQALDAAATFATFGGAAGLAGDDLVNFSTGFVGLASDMASFNNTTPEQAIQAIGAALRGEAEPMRQYGVLLDDATLRQKALELGLSLIHISEPTRPY